MLDSHSYIGAILIYATKLTNVLYKLYRIVKGLTLPAFTAKMLPNVLK